MKRTKIKAPSKYVMIGNRIFPSIKEASRVLEIDERSIKYRLDKKMLINGEKGEYVCDQCYEGLGLLKSN